MSRLALSVLFLQTAAALTFRYGPVDALQSPANQSPAVPEIPTAQAPVSTSPQAPANASPSVPPPTVDPAAAIFSKKATAGLLLVTVKPDKVADYEEVIRALQEGLSTSTGARQQALGKGWRVFKADTDPKANAVYVHLIDPVVPEADYRPSLVLDEILGGASAEMLVKYRDAIVGAPAILSMNEFARMSTRPPEKPANTSPDAPVPVKKPGG